MTAGNEGERGKILPSEFMRKQRPELYSDTADRTAYQLDAPTLEYQLESITARNQTHYFEIFCRKLCERAICPNLKPATGPEGGGDSKADTETVPIADEMAARAFIGSANSGRERWAFAFSAKKKWAEKVRNDVAGIVATGREYQRVYCVTAQFARAKDRAAIEDELTKKYDIPVTVLDRTWIVEQIIDGDRKDIAFNYLGVGQEVKDAHRLGPSDYSRKQQLEDIEKSIGNPQAFEGMEMQLVTEALVAAKLSRSLELNRTETDGRFARAVRLAEAHGTYRQRLDARYELIWTSYWWFDDIDLVNSSYDAFEVLALTSDHAKNLEPLCNLAQLLFNSVFFELLTLDEAKLADRISRLRDRLQVMSAEAERPNHALEALTSLLVIQVNQAMLDRDHGALAILWPQFSELIKKAKGLGEFSAERLIRMIDVYGMIAGKDPGYACLVDELAGFVAERTSEGQGALVLLKRAEQLDFDDKFEMIRLLGKAVRQLTKKEYVDSLIDATRLLALAYRSAGLLWAARACCIFTIASIFIEAEEDSDLPASVVPTVVLLAWIAVELRHLPDALESIRLVRGCAAGLPLDDASKQLVAKRVLEFDMVLGSQILNFVPGELERADRLPDVFGSLGLYQSRSSLLYALGHEPVLREEGWIPPEESSENAAEFFALLSSQPASDNLRGPVIFNEHGQQIYVSSVLGMRVEVHHNGSDASALVAETLMGSVEALFATAIDLDIQSHTELFIVTIHESAESKTPKFTLDEERMTATIAWPMGLLPGAVSQQEEVQKTLIALSTSLFAATCYVEDLKATVRHLFDDASALDRISMIVVVGNSRQRVFKGSLSRLGDWTKLANKAFPLQLARPTIVRRKFDPPKDGKEVRHARFGELPPPEFSPKDHRDVGVRSVIDIHLWNRASWRGTAYADWGPKVPPVMALLFTDGDAAKKIFERWHERFGQVDIDGSIFIAIVRGISAKNPAHYRLLITSRRPSGNDLQNGQSLTIASRMQTMEPATDVNLAHFLGAIGPSSTYLLVPAILKSGGEPKLLLDLGILKRDLSVKFASEVTDQDIEIMALGAMHQSKMKRKP